MSWTDYLKHSEMDRLTELSAARSENIKERKRITDRAKARERRAMIRNEEGLK